MNEVRGDGTPTRLQRAEAHLRVATEASRRADEVDRLARATRAGQVDSASANLAALESYAVVLRLVSGAAAMEVAHLTGPEVAAPSTLWGRVRWLLVGG